MSRFASAFEHLDDDARHEFWASLALRHTPGLGGRSCKRLLECFGSAYAAIRHIKEWARAEVGQDKIHAVATEAWRAPAKEEWAAARGVDGEIILWTDSRYPALLRDLPDAPVLLYCAGNTHLLAAPSVAVVGMRSCSEEGRRVAGAMAGALAASGVTVVSGLALGIDRAAHAAALTLPGSTIAVLGTGLEQEYPKSNADMQRAIRQNGLLVSEFAPGTPPEAKHFPIRNRIISGLSLGILVVEAALRSGSLITARLALEQNRAVYAIPGGIGTPQSVGCQELIRQGAQPVFSVADILRDLAPLLHGHYSGANTEAQASAEACTSEQAEQIEPSGTSEPLLASAQPPARALRVAAKSARPVSQNGPEPAPKTVSKQRPDPGTASSAQSGNAPVSAVAQTPGTSATPSPLRSTADRVLVALAGGNPMDTDTLCRTLELGASEVSSTLIQLEVLGRIRRLPNHWYALL